MGDDTADLSDSDYYELVPIHCLVPTDSYEGQKIRELLRKGPAEDDTDACYEGMKPRIVPWEELAAKTSDYASDPTRYPTQPKDIEKVMYEIWKSAQSQGSGNSIMIFMEGHDVISMPHTAIVALPDSTYLWHSKATHRALCQLSDTLIASGDLPPHYAYNPESDHFPESIYHPLEKMGDDRGLTYSRVDLGEWKCAHSNLGLGNISLKDITRDEDGFGTEEYDQSQYIIRLIANPDWDGRAFLLALGEFRQQVELEEWELVDVERKRSKRLSEHRGE